MALWTAFSLGLIGSLHCVGMCGPLALSLPYQGGNKLATGFNMLLYNTGRIMTYGMLGLLIGFLGQGMQLAGIQQWLSLGLGLLLLAAVAFSINIEYQLLRWQPLARHNEWVKRKLSNLMHGRRGPLSLFAIGMINGLLPCGLVYLAIFGALATEIAWKGGAYMALFGLGTLPLMLATGLAGQVVNLKWRQLARKLVPVALTAMAILLIMRGVNFEVPHEFRFWEIGQEVPRCH